MTYDPENWLLSTTRSIKDYVLANLPQQYDVVMEFPSTEKIEQYVPLENTLIHFEIDAVDSHPVGFGEVIGLYNYDPVGQFSKPQEARRHLINFDVGVWSSDRSGGTTTRMRARQYLENLFGGAQARRKFDDAVNVGEGTIEIINFTGGRFATDTINDVNVYRTIDGVLEVRVFSRTPLPSAEYETIEGLVIDDILQDQELDILT